MWTTHPPRAHNVPAVITRTHHEAVTGSGPAIVDVPMDDWLQPAEDRRDAAALGVRIGRPALGSELEELASLLNGARRPAIVVGSAADGQASWTSTAPLAVRVGAPVWQESFGARAGFPQDPPAFAGHLPPGRAGVGASLADHDVLLVLGAPVLRRYPWEPGDLATPDIAGVQVTPYADEAHHSIADLALVADISVTCRALVEQVAARHDPRGGNPPPAAAVAPPGTGSRTAQLSLRRSRRTRFRTARRHERPEVRLHSAHVPGSHRQGSDAGQCAGKLP